MIIVIPKVGQFDSRSIVAMSEPCKEFVASKLSFKVLLDATTYSKLNPLEVICNDQITEERLYEIHQNIFKVWSKNQELLEV